MSYESTASLVYGCNLADYCEAKGIDTEDWDCEVYFHEKVGVYGGDCFDAYDSSELTLGFKTKYCMTVEQLVKHAEKVKQLFEDDGYYGELHYWVELDRS